MKGIITKIVSNQYTVDNKYVCSSKGKFRYLKTTPLVGDIVDFDLDTLVINDIKKRKNELKRPSVANIDIALVVTSLKTPDLSFSLLDKQLSVILNSKIEPIICLTKLDLLSKAQLKDLKFTFKYYESIGIKVIDNKHLFKLKHLLKNKTVVLTGQTGAGKSSLLNKIDKNLHLETNEVSKALNRGVHTTRFNQIITSHKIHFVDTPGFSALDLDMSKEELKDTFLEFKAYNCKYANCFHQLEKGCEVKNDVGKKILPSRYINYGRFLNECSSKLHK